MAERYLSNQDDDSADRGGQSPDGASYDGKARGNRSRSGRTQGGSSRKSRKRRIRVTQNGQPDGNVSETPIESAETIVERTRRVTRPAADTGYSASALRGYDDYLDDDFLEDDFPKDDILEDDEFIDDVLVGDRFVDEIEIQERRRTTARRPTRGTPQHRLESRYEDSYENRYEQSHNEAPPSQTDYVERGYTQRGNLRSHMPSMSMANQALPNRSMPRRPRMPRLPMHGGLSELVGRGRVAMAILMGLLAFIGYSVSSNSAKARSHRASPNRASSVHRRPEGTDMWNSIGTTAQPVHLDAEHDVAFGTQLAGHIIESNGGLSEDRNLRVQVQQIGTRLVQNSAAAQSAFRFHFDVLADTETIAAYDVPGGQVYLTAGLIAQLTSEDEIAAILAHEMAHATNRHTVARLAQAQLPSGNDSRTAIASFHDPARFQSTTADASQLIRASAAIQYNASETRNSDELAVRWLIQSNIDPNALASALKRINQVAGQRTDFAVRHPSEAGRYAFIQQKIEQYTTANGT